jgi:acetyl-CoA acetyltransferase
MAEAYIIDAVRTPIGRKKGSLAAVHPADLGAHPIKALVSAPGSTPIWSTMSSGAAATPSGRKRATLAAPSGWSQACRSMCRARRSTASAARANRRSISPRKA